MPLSAFTNFVKINISGIEDSFVLGQKKENAYEAEDK